LLQVAEVDPSVSFEILPFTVDKLRPSRMNVCPVNNTSDLNPFMAVDVEHSIVEPATAILQSVPCEEESVTVIKNFDPSDDTKRIGDTSSAE